MIRWIRAAIAFVFDWFTDMVTFAEAGTPNEVREAIIERQEGERFAPKLVSSAQEAPREVREPEKPKFRTRPPKLPVGGVAFDPSTIGAVDEKDGTQGYTFKRRISPRRQGKKALKKIGASRKEIKRTERAHRRLATWKCPRDGCTDRLPHRHLSVQKPAPKEEPNV